MVTDFLSVFVCANLCPIYRFEAKLRWTVMTELRSFGEWLRHKRKAHDLTREGLAERVGYSAATIRKLEAEERRPSAQLAGRLTNLFNIPPEERTTFLRFARGDWQAAPPGPSEPAPWRDLPLSPRSNLTTPTTSLIGRQKELAAVHQYLLRADIRLITLIGPLGIGKTRLSIEAARGALPHFPDGVFFIALAPLNDPSLITPAIVQTLGFGEMGHQLPPECLKDGIGEKQMLLVLDNLEHLIEDVAPLVYELLLSCPRLHILATSREALHIPGEWSYSVPPLAVPQDAASIQAHTSAEFPALTLFAERARAVQPDFALDANNIRPVASICARVDGLPLAIELMAARIRLMSPETLLARMNGQFVLSSDGVRAVPDRQKTLANAIDWGYNLLSTGEQQLLVRLSRFSGGFDLEVVETLCAGQDAGEALELLAQLVNKSLVATRHEPGQGVHYYLLKTIRQFARAKLKQWGETGVS
jgi:predicted ATPase/DNA-binding XRE family transcriptional regulator